MAVRVEEVVRRRVLREVENYPSFRRAVIALSAGRIMGASCVFLRSLSS
jgi:hypothetical protein